ncbi:MAG: Outer rane lipoprotein [Betaproteobacteria bacterium]|jgi:TolA-binding protein|nr:Outer rane lipoprotein [Betaproteobacteria bacterium]
MKIATLSAAFAALAIATALPDATAQSSSAQIKDMLGSLWGRLRAATPRSSATAPTTTVTAGLRGSEATESELKPYWRGDRESDAGSIAERKALEGAQALADSGKFAEAVKAYDAFLQQNPRSPLAANAVFGSALAHAALGDKARATAGFQDFIKREPQHPLAKDAEQAIAALK